MGIINHDVMTLESGLQLSECYMSFTPGPLDFPNLPPAMKFHWTIDPVTGSKIYTATAMLYIHTTREAKKAGLAPVEMRSVSVPALADSQIVGGVFDYFFAEMHATYPNTVNVLPNEG